MTEPRRMQFHYYRNPRGDWYWIEGNDADGPLSFDDVTAQWKSALYGYRLLSQRVLAPLEFSIMHYYPLEPEAAP